MSIWKVIDQIISDHQQVVAGAKVSAETIDASLDVAVDRLKLQGYPEPVARRIATGELPMDEASRMARAAEQGYGEVMYRGHSSRRPPRSNEDMFMTPERDVAETYATGGEVYDEKLDDYVQLPGEVTPLRTNASNLAEADGLGHDWTWPTLRVKGIGEGIGTDEISSYIKRARETVPGANWQGTKFESVIDDMGGKAMEPSDVYNILGSQPEVGIRHAENAAFDPEYNGSSIMGGATVPALATAGAGGGILATIAANLESIIPESTMSTLADMGLVDSAVGVADTAVRAGQGAVNDLALGGTMIKNAVADTDSKPWELDIDPGTEQGNTLAGSLIEDLSKLLSYEGALGNMPSALDMISGGVDAYKEYIQPHLNDRVEEGLGGAGILAASLLGVKKVPTRTVGEEIVTDVYDPPKIEKGGVVTPYSQNPVLANIDLDGPRPDNIASSQWKKKQRQMEDPVIRAREEARPAGGRAVGADNLEAGLISYEDLAREGTPMVWLPADGTMVADVVQVGGRQIDPVAANGGPLHADKYGSWMSMNNAATKKQGHAQTVLAETGESPMYIHVNMGNEGSNFSHMPSEIWTNYVERYPMHGQGWDVLNARMSSLPDEGDTKGVSADWIEAGVDSPEGLRGFLLPNYGATRSNSTTGNRRKIFMDTVAKAGVQDAGGPIVNDIYSSLLEPSLLGQKGMAGYRGMGSVDMPADGLLTDLNRHASYDTIIPGNGSYIFREGMVPAEVMFPDAFNAPHRASKTERDRYRSVQVNNTEHQIADQQWLDGIMSYLESVNR